MDRLIILLNLILALGSYHSSHGCGVVQGCVFDAISGQAIVGVRALLGKDHIAFTDERGWFRIKGIPPGDYLFCVEDQSHKPWFLQLLVVKRDTAIEMNVGLMSPKVLSDDHGVSVDYRIVYYVPDTTGFEQERP
jgi:hypothetical protein